MFNPYTVTYSFAGYQAMNPGSPLPAMELDEQLANLAAHANQIGSDLAQVRRDDGGLQNGVVSWDSLDPDVKAKFGDLGEVSVGDLSPSAFASQSEAEAGAANDKIMTPLTVKQAVDSYRARSSQSQAQAGSDNTTAMTPLRVKEALDALRGLASQAQAEAGTDNTRVVTPLRLTQALNAKRAAKTTLATLTFGTIAAGGAVDQPVSLTGAAVNNGVILGLPAVALPAGVVASAWVSVAGTVTVRLTNVTAAPITPTASQVYRVTAIDF